jgi:hypothetical protein
MSSYVAEAAGSGEYLAVVATISATTQIEIFYNDGGGYYPTNVSTPNPGNPNNCNGNVATATCPAGTYYVEHAPRLVYLPRVDITKQSVGLLYQAVELGNVGELYWEVLIATTGGGSPTVWTPTSGAVGPIPPVQRFSTNTGFSVATVVKSDTYGETAGTQYLAYLAYSTAGAQYIRTAAYIPGSGWGNFQELPTTSGYTPSYVKLTYSAQDISTQEPFIYVFYDSNYDMTTGVLTASTYGATTPFDPSCTLGCSNYSDMNNDLVTPGSTSTYPDYNNPRIEAPEYVTSFAYIPVWIQYQYSSSENSLLFWWVPVSTPST